MKTFLLEIITPERIAFTDQVEMVTAPSASGQIGVLPRIRPQIAAVTEGPAKEVGLREGDLILGADGEHGITQERFIEIIKAHEGKPMVVEVAEGLFTIAVYERLLWLVP